jgi:hypothetical protein
MSRTSPPVVQSKDDATRAPDFLQSEATRLTQDVRPTRRHSMPRRAAKEPVSRLPRPKVLRIQQRYIAGENQTVISRAEGCDRETVSRIVKSSEMTEYVERMREEFRGLVPDALVTLRYALQIQKDARIAYDVLRDVGVIPCEMQGQPAETSGLQTEEYLLRLEWAKRLALMAIEKHVVFGASLPDVQMPTAAKSLRGEK